LLFAKSLHTHKLRQTEQIFNKFVEQKVTCFILILLSASSIFLSKKGEGKFERYIYIVLAVELLRFYEEKLNSFLIINSYLNSNQFNKIAFIRNLI
jgi:hypothetical protein